MTPTPEQIHAMQAGRETLQAVLDCVVRNLNDPNAKLPCRVDEMTDREYEIFKITAAYGGALLHIQGLVERELRAHAALIVMAGRQTRRVRRQQVKAMAHSIQDDNYNQAIHLLREIARHEAVCLFSIDNPTGCLIAIRKQTESVLRLLETEAAAEAQERDDGKQ